MLLLMNAEKMQHKTIKYMQLTPYIMFNGNCEEALNFYAKALGGGIVHLFRYEGSPMESMASDKQKIMHATMIAKDITIKGADDERSGTENKGSGAVHLNIILIIRMKRKKFLMH